MANLVIENLGQWVLSSSLVQPRLSMTYVPRLSLPCKIIWTALNHSHLKEKRQTEKYPSSRSQFVDKTTVKLHASPPTRRGISRLSRITQSYTRRLLWKSSLDKTLTPFWPPSDPLLTPYWSPADPLLTPLMTPYWLTLTTVFLRYFHCLIF